MDEMNLMNIKSRIENCFWGGFVMFYWFRMNKMIFVWFYLYSIRVIVREGRGGKGGEGGIWKEEEEEEEEALARG